MSTPVTYKRRYTGTAPWHLSREAVSISVKEVFGWTKQQCLDYLVQVRFGDWDSVDCPHCRTVGKHYWRPLQSRWKCAGCHKTFSVTSGTVFAYHKRSLQDIISSVLLWLNSAAGQPALELKRHMNTTYNTAFTLQHKMREAMMRGYNVGLVSGDLEMDGAHQSGRRAAEKRGKPQVSMSFEDAPAEGADAEPDEKLLTLAGQKKERKKRQQGEIDPEFGWRMPKDRRIVLAVRKRSGQKGKGAMTTRIAVGLAETTEVAESVIRGFVVVPESKLNTDASPAYKEPGKHFISHHKVEHAKMLVGPLGENNNQVEEYNWRMDRAEHGVYLNIEPKYLLDYAVEASFRADTRRLPNGDQLKLALSLAMNVGKSLFWTGFTRGRHRAVELTHPAPRTAPASGPKKEVDGAGRRGKLPR